MKMTAVLTAPLKTSLAGVAAPEIKTSAAGDPGVYAPGDVLAGALAACTASMISYTAKSRGFDPGAVKVEVDYTMSMSPHRIGSFAVTVTGAKPLDAKSQKILEGAAKSCPVKASLNPEIPVTLAFNW